MGTLEIPPKETVRIASANEGRRWEIDIERGVIRFDKNPQRVANDGRKRQSGEKGRVELSSGETLYAWSENGGEIEVSRGNFAFDLFTTRVVESPGESAAKTGDLFRMYGNLSMDPDGGANPNDDTVLSNPYPGVEVGDNPQYVEMVSVATTSGHTSDLHVILQITKENSQVVWEIVVNPPVDPIAFDPPLPVPEGGEVSAHGFNDSANSVGLEVSGVVRNDI